MTTTKKAADLPDRCCDQCGIGDHDSTKHGIEAADPPEGSVVANDRHAFIKTHPTKESQWRGTDGSYAGDWYVQGLLDKGAVVLREGY